VGYNDSVESGIRYTLRGLFGQVLREYFELNGSWSWVKDHVWAGGELLATVEPSGIKHLHRDHLGSVRVETASNGALLTTHSYWPFGEEMTVTSSSERYRFAGHEWDQRTGYDYMHARYYAPMAGRFFSPDPVRGDPAQPQSLNLYAYVRGNPINFVDLKDQGAMSPASTSDESQRDGVCADVMSDPDCWNEQITVTAKAPRIGLQQIANAHDAKVLQEWLEWQAYTNSAYALRTARYAGQVVPTDPMANWQRAAYHPQDPMVQILGQVASTTQPWINLGETYMEWVVGTLGAEALKLAVQEVRLAYGARVALDSRKLHTFMFRGSSYRLPHIQLTWWRLGIPGSATHIRIPLLRWFTNVRSWQKYF
jgi:RHS repeat-associated protein